MINVWHCIADGYTPMRPRAWQNIIFCSSTVRHDVANLPFSRRDTLPFSRRDTHLRRALLALFIDTKHHFHGFVILDLGKSVGFVH